MGGGRERRGAEYKLARWLPLLTVLMRAGWLAAFPADSIDPVDAEGFHLLAVNVLAGRGFAIGWEPPFCPTAVRTPLYPLFLTGSYLALGVDPSRAVLLQVLMEALTTALVIRLGRDLGGARAGILAGGLYALNGTTQRYTGYLLSEALLLPVLTAAVELTVCALHRPSSRRVALSAMFWALAVLTKPNVQFLVFAVGGLVTWRCLAGDRLNLAVSPIGQAKIQNPKSKILVFWVILLGMLFPWLVRNRVVMGRWVLSTAFEENLARVSAVAVLAEIEDVQADPWTETWEHIYGRLVSDAGARYAWRDSAAAQLPCAEARLRQQQVAEVAREVVWQHPCEWLATHFWGVALSLFDPGHHLWYRVLTGGAWETTGVVGNIWTRMAWALERWALGDALSAFWSERVAHIPLDAALIWWTLLLGRLFAWGLGGRGLWQLRRTPWLAFLCAGTVAYILLLPGPIAYDRFYIPAIPITTVLIALGVTQINPL